MMTRETEFILTVIVLVVVGGAAAWFMIWFHRNRPLQKLRQKTTPEPLQKWPRVRFSFVDLMKWQGPVDRIEGANRNVAPECGPHLLSFGPHRAILRAGGENYMRRIILMPFFLLPLFAVSLWITLRNIIPFFTTPSHRTRAVETVVDGESVFSLVV